MWTFDVLVFGNCHSMVERWCAIDVCDRLCWQHLNLTAVKVAMAQNPILLGLLNCGWFFNNAYKLYCLLILSECCKLFWCPHCYGLLVNDPHKCKSPRRLHSASTRTLVISRTCTNFQFHLFRTASFHLSVMTAPLRQHMRQFWCYIN